MHSLKHVSVGCTCHWPTQHWQAGHGTVQNMSRIVSWRLLKPWQFSRSLSCKVIGKHHCLLVASGSSNKLPSGKVYRVGTLWSLITRPINNHTIKPKLLNGSGPKVVNRWLDAHSCLSLPSIKCMVTGVVTFMVIGVVIFILPEFCNNHYFSLNEKSIITCILDWARH